MTNRPPLSRFDASQWNLPGPLLLVLGPPVGLLYVVVLPVIGLVTLIFLALSHVKNSLPVALRKFLKIPVKA